MTEKQKNKNLIAGVLIILAGVIFMVVMIKLKKVPPRHPLENKGILVETISAEISSVNVSIEATGEVAATQKIDIIPQVGGKVVSVAKNFERGSFFKTGDLLYQIDTADYLIALEKAKAQVAKAENDLLETEGKAEVALKEWEISQKFSQTKAASPLVLYEPQLKKARAALTSAKADEKKAHLNIRRAKITAPFNCIVNYEYIEIGKFVSAGSKTAEILGTDRFDIALPLPYSEVSLLQIPEPGKDGNGSSATIYLQSGSLEFKWKSYVSKLLGNIEKNTYMPKLLISIPDPYNLKNTHGQNTPPLAEGFFVKAVIKGKTFENIFTIPPKSLRDNNNVWIYSENKTLLMKEVSLLRREKTRTIISGGLTSGDKIILSSVNGAANGMKLRLK